ncbi:MAG: hypothetical protein M3R15_01175, partial [Acidobacteriota bacterium]|nr:hypothetical protein [Acidobacteriota bacterium]
AEWYQEHGRHAVYAKGKAVPNIGKVRTLSLPIVSAILAQDNGEPAAAVTPYLVEEEQEEAVV